MALVGQSDLKNIVLPSTIDGAELHNLEMVKGVTHEEILTDINDALDVAESNVYSDPLIGSLIYRTEQPEVEYRQGNTNGFEDSTEYGEGDEERAETGGHMLPISEKDRKLGWSKKYLKKARRFQIEADIAAAIEDYEEIIPKRILTRFFSKDGFSGQALGLGANGKSLPFCDGSTAFGVKYVPPRGRDGVTFDSTHSHYLRLDGINQANVEIAVKHVHEHKHDAPFDLLASAYDLADWIDKTAVTGFKERGSFMVAYGLNQTLAQVEDIYIGVIETPYGPVRLMVNGRIPTGYWSVRKSYGTDNPRNPLYVRFDEESGRAPRLEVPQPKLLPVEGAIIVFNQGEGIGEDRTSAVLVLNAGAGNYANPTIS